jgi:hypothetical protein
MKNHYVLLPVAPLTADAVRTVMEVLDGAMSCSSVLLVRATDSSICMVQGRQRILKV